MIHKQSAAAYSPSSLREMGFVILGSLPERLIFASDARALSVDVWVKFLETSGRLFPIFQRFSIENAEIAPFFLHSNEE